MKIRYKATLIISVVIFVTSAFSGYLNYLSNQNLAKSCMETELKIVSNMIRTFINSSASQAASLASLIANNTNVQEAFRSQDRERLGKVTIPSFNIQKEKFGVVDGHFHLPSAISFLRVYKPDVYGDDLSKTREIILAAQKKQAPLQGIEISTTGVSIKGVDIIKDDKGFVGTLEVGLSFSAVLDNIKKITGFELAAFINNEKMNKIAIKAAPPDPEQIIGGYRAIFSTDWSKIRPAATPQLLTTTTDVFYKTETVHNNLDGIVLVPLLDFKGEQIGSIIALGNFVQYQKELQINLLMDIASVFTQCVLLAAVVFIIFNALFLMPIEDVINKIRKLSEGQADDQDHMGIWAQRTDEVGSLARNLQKLNELVKKQSAK